MKQVFVSAVLVTLAAPPAVAEPLDPLCEGGSLQIVRESFSARDTAGWGFDCRADFIAPGGGNPDAFLRNQEVDTFAPWAMTCDAAAGAFLGDYRDKGVVALAADFITLSVSVTTEARPLSLVLIHHAGTPDDVSDDLMVYYVGDTNIPAPTRDVRAGWVSYQFEVPSDSPGLPRPRSTGDGEPGWVAAYGDEVSRPADDPDAVWNTVIENVDQVTFWWHDPRYFAIMQRWDVGMDNPSLITCVD